MSVISEQPEPRPRRLWWLPGMVVFSLGLLLRAYVISRAGEVAFLAMPMGSVDRSPLVLVSLASDAGLGALILGGAMILVGYAAKLWR